jgi:predicted dehydrogenase
VIFVGKIKRVRVKNMGTALVIGCGFGKNILRIISRLPSEYGIDMVVGTKTTEASALALATEMNDNALTLNQVVGAQVSTAEELETVLDAHTPEFVVVAAKDRREGNNIHPLYVKLAQAREYVRMVLCEKPLADATGNGATLAVLDEIDPQRFAYEKTYALLRQEMERHPDFYRRLCGASTIDFRWITKGSGIQVINDLLVHPESVIPLEFDFKEVIHAENNGNNAHIQLLYQNGQKRVHIRIALAYGPKMKPPYDGDFTGFELDGGTIDQYTVCIKRDPTTYANVLVHTDTALRDLLKFGSYRADTHILQVVNPLEAHVKAALSGTPIAGLDEARKSQELAEAVYKRANE